MKFQKIVEQVLNEQNTSERVFRKPSHGTGVLGGLVTNTGKFHSVPADHPHDGSWHGRSSDEDSTTSKQANNKMGKHTRGNSLRSGRTGKGSKSKASKKR